MSTEESEEVEEKVSETRFSLRQLLAIAGTLSAVSGAGGALTVRAQDAVQDERIEQHERQISELRAQVLAATTAATETRESVRGLEEPVSELRADIKEIQRLLNRLIGARAGTADREGSL